MPEKHFETPEILSDLPLKDGKATSFHFDEFAVTLARLIAEKKTLTPLTIGVSGAWGAGDGVSVCEEGFYRDVEFKR